MRRSTEIAVAAAAAGIALLAGLGIYLGISLHTMKKNEIFLDGLTGYETEPAGPVVSENRTDPVRPGSVAGAIGSKTGNGASETVLEPSEPGKEMESDADEIDPQTAAALRAARLQSLGLPEHRVIFVGDSRVVGMGEAEEENYDECVYIGAVGEGYPWFMEEGLAQMEEAIRTWPDAPVVINLGVNDLEDIDLYLGTYRTFGDNYPDTRFVFLSVNPVDGEDLTVDNMGISEFNAQLRAAFPDSYMDSSSYLRSREFETVDGLHYTEEYYRCIHDFVVRMLFRQD